jgi:hypothetical protein
MVAVVRQQAALAWADEHWEAARACVAEVVVAGSEVVGSEAGNNRGPSPTDHNDHIDHIRHCSRPLCALTNKQEGHSAEESQSKTR